MVYRKKITMENVMSMPSEHLIEKILEFCEEFDYDISEVLDLFDNKENKELLYISCVESGVIRDPEMKKILQARLDVWEEDLDDLDDPDLLEDFED